MEKARLLKGLLTSLFFVFGLMIAAAQTTTVWIVRHAEKDTALATRANPDLNVLGKQRALDLASFLKQEKVEFIYSTDTKRTKQTAAHFTAPITIYSPQKLQELPSLLDATAKGKTVLLIGHSNTVLETIEALGGQRPVKALSDEDYDYIFKVELKQNAPTIVKAFQFGKAHRGGVATMR
jgi:phosphohistidine phosphatase SixA